MRTLALLGVTLLLLAAPTAFAGPIAEAGGAAMGIACSLPGGNATWVACLAVAQTALVIPFADSWAGYAERVARGYAEDPQTAWGLVCAEGIVGEPCGALSGDPGYGAVRPCTVHWEPRVNLLAGTLWYAMNGGNWTFGLPFWPGVTVPMTGVDPTVGAFTSERLAGTPLAGERPCADHRATLHALLP